MKKIFGLIVILSLIILSGCNKPIHKVYKIEDIHFVENFEKTDMPTFIKDTFYVYNVTVSQNDIKRKFRYVSKKSLNHLRTGDSITFVKYGINKINN